jgi:hypothetical protein
MSPDGERIQGTMWGDLQLTPGRAEKTKKGQKQREMARSEVGMMARTTDVVGFQAEEGQRNRERRRLWARQICQV